MSIKEKCVQLIILFLLCIVNTYSVMAESLYDVGYKAGVAFAESQCDVTSNDALIRNECDITSNDAIIRGECDITSNDAIIRNECDVTSNDALIRGECDVTSNDAIIRNECDVTSNDAIIRNECDVTSNDAIIRGECDVTSNDAIIRNECDITSNDAIIRDECDITSNDAIIRGECDITSNDQIECNKCSLVMHQDGSFTAPAIVWGDDLIPKNDYSPVELSLDSVIRESRGFYTLKVDKIAEEELPNPNAKSILEIVSTEDKLEDIFTKETIGSIGVNNLTCTSPYHCRLSFPIQVGSNDEINKLSLNTIDKVEWFGSKCINQQDSAAGNNSDQQDSTDSNSDKLLSFVSNECTVQFDRDYQVVVIKKVVVK